VNFLSAQHARATKASADQQRQQRQRRRPRLRPDRPRFSQTATPPAAARCSAAPRCARPCRAPPPPRAARRAPAPTARAAHAPRRRAWRAAPSAVSSGVLRGRCAKGWVVWVVWMGGWWSGKGTGFCALTALAERRLRAPQLDR